MEIPVVLIDKVRVKVNNDTFDVGNVIGFKEDSQWLVANADLSPLDDAYLIDHMWSFESIDSAYKQMHANVDLVKRLISMTSNIDNDIDINESVIDKLFEQLIYLFGSYYDNDNDNKVYYLMDEVGTHLQPAKSIASANCVSTLIQCDTCAYTVIWFIKNIRQHETIKCYNLPNGINKYRCLSRVLIDDDTNDDIMIKDNARNLKDMLISHDYNTTKINSMVDQISNTYLQCWQHSSIASRSKTAEMLYRDYSDDDEYTLVNLVVLFYLGVSVKKADAIAILGLDLFTFLVSANICLLENDMITALVQFTPVHLPDGDDDLIMMTDYAHHGSWTGLGLEEEFDPVMYIGPDSLGLVHYFQANGRSYTNGLDICSGTGIQAVAAIKQKKLLSATCIDINPRAIRFLHFNANMNRVDDKVNIVNADITDSDDMMNILKQYTFDVILFNPPYIPSNSDDDDDDEFLLFGSGGRNGEDIIIKAFRILSTTVKNVDCYMVANFINCDDYPRKLNEWFNTHCCRGCLFHGPKWSPSEYSSLVLPPTQYNCSRENSRLKYERFLIKSGVKDVVNGVLTFSFNNNNENNNSKVLVIPMGCEIWQVLSGATNNNLKIKREIQDNLKLVFS